MASGAGERREKRPDIRARLTGPPAADERHSSWRTRSSLVPLSNPAGAW